MKPKIASFFAVVACLWPKCHEILNGQSREFRGKCFFTSAKYWVFFSGKAYDKQCEGLVLIPSFRPIVSFKLELLIALLMERGRQLMMMTTAAFVVVVYICSSPFVGQYNGQSRQTYTVGQTH